MTTTKPLAPDVTLENAWQHAKAELACAHQTTALTVKIATNGSRHYRTQCLQCGENLGAVQASSLHFKTKDEAREWDEELHKGGHARVVARWIEIQDEITGRRDREWRAWYDAYLRSPEWRARRAAVLARDKGLCQGCLVAPATQVHHLTYAHAGAELLFELTSVCDDCHRRVHETTS